MGQRGNLSNQPRAREDILDSGGHVQDGRPVRRLRHALGDSGCLLLRRSCGCIILAFSFPPPVLRKRLDDAEHVEEKDEKEKKDGGANGQHSASPSIEQSKQYTRIVTVEEMKTHTAAAKPGGLPGERNPVPTRAEQESRAVIALCVWAYWCFYSPSPLGELYAPPPLSKASHGPQIS